METEGIVKKKKEKIDVGNLDGQGWDRKGQVTNGGTWEDAAQLGQGNRSVREENWMAHCPAKQMNSGCAT